MDSYRANTGDVKKEDNVGQRMVFLLFKFLSNKHVYMDM